MNTSLFSSGLNIACHTVSPRAVPSPHPAVRPGGPGTPQGCPAPTCWDPRWPAGRKREGPSAPPSGAGPWAAGPGRDPLSWHFPVLSDVRKHFFFPALLMNGLKVAPSLFSLFVHSIKSQICLNTHSRANSSFTAAAWLPSAVQVSVTSDLGALECCHSIL